MPFFSIITASYNSEKTIKETLESILNQTYSNLEYIIVDGGSSDSTIEIIKSYESKFKEKKIRFYWISEEDTGIYNAWNKGLKIVEGKWVAFIGSDDIFYPNTFENYYNYIQERPDLDFISAKTKMIINGKIARVMGEEWNWNVFKREMKVGHVGAIHNMDYFKRYGFFDDSYKITGDYELLLRAKDELKFGFLDDFTADMGGEGVSSTLIFKTLKEAKRAKIESGGRSPFISFLEMYFVYSKILVKNLFKKFF